MNNSFNAIWSQSIDNILTSIAINSDKNEKRYYPDKDSACFRLSKSEKEIDALKRLINECLNDKLNSITPNPNLLLLVFVNWSSKNVFHNYSIQAFICEDCSIEELFYLERDFPELYYYRLDCHPDALGELFKEPFSHLHINNKRNPRFNFVSEDNGNHILKFIEFIYINHFYSDWLTWVEEVCSKSGLSESYQEIVNYFKISNYQHLLSNKSESITALKKELTKRKEKYSWKHSIDASILSY